MTIVSDTALAKVREYTIRNMDGLVTILRPGENTLDEVTGVVSGLADTTTIYDDEDETGAGGIARVHVVSGRGSISNGGAGQIDMRQVTVSIPWTAAMPHRDDLVIVRDGGQDYDLDGDALRVVEVSGGGLFGECRRMSCTLWGKSRYWTGTGAGP